MTDSENSSTRLVTRGESWPDGPSESGSNTKIEAAMSAYRTFLFCSDAHLHSLSLNAETLLDWWRRRHSPKFVSPARISELREIYDERDLERSLMMRRADHLLNGKMPLLAHEPVDFSGPDRWRRDHILGVSAPSGSGAEIDIFDTNVAGDIRRVWEPSRCGWVYWLGQAYLISAASRYAETFEALTMDWFAQDQAATGINYYSTKEIALRLYAFVHALDLFADYLKSRPVLLSTLLSGVWLSCVILEKRMALGEDSRADRIIPSFALFAAGAFFPEFAEAYEWRSMGRNGLRQSIEKEFVSDGTHRSHSASSILYAADCFVQALLIADKTGFEIDEVVSLHTRKIVSRLAQIAPPDLILPQFNDCDGGSLCGFGMSPRDAAPALQAAAMLFEELTFPDGDRIGAGYALWMSDMKDEYESISDEELMRVNVSTTQSELSCANPLRDDSHGQPGLLCHKNAQGDYLLARSQSGIQELSTAHDAPAGFILYLNKRPVIVDNGTGSFMPAEERRSFRSARGKNALLVNGCGPSLQAGPFAWTEFCPVRLMTSGPFEGGFYALLKSDGFSRACGFSVVTERELILLDEGLFLLVDSWTAEREIAASLELTVTPELQISRSGRMIFEEDGALFHYLISPQFAVVDDEEEGKTVDSDNQEELIADTDASAESDESNGSEEPDMMRDIRFRPKITSRPFSPEYGIIGESPALVSEFLSSQTGTVVTIFSRIGPVKNTSDLSIFRVGEEDHARELIVGASGKISLQGARHGPQRDQPVVFAR